MDVSWEFSTLNILLTIHKGDKRFLLNSVQEFIEIEARALLIFFVCLQSFKF